MSIDKYFGRKFHRKTYNCYHFTRDVWQDLTGYEMKLDEQIFESDGRLTREYVRQFIAIDKPVSPCIIVMQRPRFAPHIGTFLRGRVLHMQEIGVEFQPIDVASRGFKTVRMALCRIS